LSQIEFGLDGVSPYRRGEFAIRNPSGLEAPPGWKPQSAIGERGVALVITLLMLSAITFLAVALLVLTRSQREQATASLDVETAKAMSEAALARSQSQIIAHMKGQGDLFNFDYMVSRNYINPNGFNIGEIGIYDATNVNYDAAQTNGNPAAVAQNIANLFYDPRPPVFIRTNFNNLGALYDFRFYVDLNRNGKFEPSGLMPLTNDGGGRVLDANSNTVFAYLNGEPEWIGVLQYPDYPHSATNRFIGRYAFVVLPMGKMLDYNFIHNYSKSFAGLTTTMPYSGSTSVDGFVRDQGVGPWELNLAGLLWGVDSNAYTRPPAILYNYVQGIAPNIGWAFDDAYSFLRFRYAPNYFSSYTYGSPYPSSANLVFSGNWPSLYGIDEYGTGSLFPAVNYNSAGYPWPGSYSPNNFYDIQDVFDPTKTSTNFISRLMQAGSVSNSYDRYMFLRLLASIGSGSAPELQTYVYGDVVTTNPAVQPPTLLRTKVNLNWDNSYQISNNLNTSPTVLVPWTAETNGALAFFYNAAESLLRSQNFRFTNGLDTNGNPIIAYNHFGVTNIPIYNSTNPSIRYTEQIHRMLQLAANIYDASRIDNYALGDGVGPTVLPQPSVFRPVVYTTHTNNVYAAYIGGYVSVTNDALARIQKMMPTGPNQFPLLKMPSDSTITADDNVWGIPWVVGAVKGLPAFDRFVANTSWMVTRKLLFRRQYTINAGRTNGLPNKPPQYTNQFFIMSVTNNFGIDAWNSYAEDVHAPLQIFATTVASITLTNNSLLHPAWFVTNYTVSTSQLGTNLTYWRGSGSRTNPTMSDGMLAFLQTNIATMQPAYFSESADEFVPVYGTTNTNSINTNSTGFGYNLGRFLPGDLQQTAWPVYNWGLTVTNWVMYAMVHPVDGTTNSGKVYDFVNLGPFGTTFMLRNLLYSGTNAGSIPVQGAGAVASAATYWDPTFVSSNLPSVGVLNQITNGIQNDAYFAAEIAGTVVTNRRGGINSNLYFSCSNDVAATYPPPPSVTVWAHTLLVNDPLVHYTVGDLTLPGPVSASDSQILGENQRSEPWPLNNTIAQRQWSGYNMTLKDPLIIGSDDWNFHTGLFPSVGLLGRVHRGTPWQTVFLKADPPQFVNGVNQNQQAWIGHWVSTLDTYPTNDYGLVDLFTAAPSDNAARGLVSVNQTNDGPWYALLAGVAVNNTPPPAGHSIGPPPIAIPPPVVDPTGIAPLLYGVTVTNFDDNGVQLLSTIAGINAIRSAQPDGVFHNIGSVFNSPMLTVSSPYLNASNSLTGYFKDEEVEAIPQQVAGLLKLGQPQFVIYCYGQALKPKDIYFGSQPNLFNLCTNYQITGEYLTRAVCHVVGDPAAANVKFQVDSVNIIPAD
jgi:Tfp pilus assembly protein PilX